MPVRQELVTVCTGTWKVGLFEAPVQAPAQCLYGCCCICCASYQQRTELLDLTGEPYVCFAGLCPCGPLAQPMDRNCLFLESCCCPGMALSGNRFMIQTRFDKMNTACDDFLITFTCLFYFIIQIAQCFCDVPDELEVCAECLIMIVDGCMHAQQHIELQEIKQTGYLGPPPSIVAAMPPAMQQMVSAGKVSAAGGMGAPPPATVGQPHGGGSYAGGGAGGAVYGGGYGKSSAGGGRPNAPQATVIQAQPVAQAQSPAVQVKCGSCMNTFGAPERGVTIACPFCGAHNMVPANLGGGGPVVPMGMGVY